MQTWEERRAYNRFYYSVAKDVGDMTDAELQSEIEAAEHWADRCREVGQGINSKEVVRRRDAEGEQDRRGGLDNR